MYVPGTLMALGRVPDGFTVAMTVLSSRTRLPAGFSHLGVWQATQLRSRIGLTSRWYSTVFGPLTKRRPVTSLTSHLLPDWSFFLVVKSGVCRVRSKGT